MVFPVRCVTCNKTIADQLQDYLTRISENPDVSKGELLNNIGMTRMCCRRSFLAHAHKVEEYQKKYL